MMAEKTHWAVGYWRRRYLSGGKSGNGSRGKCGAWIAENVNGFVKAKKLKSIVEFGCGDGCQLGQYDFNNIKYTGYDVSKIALDQCEEQFKEDKKKNFKVFNGEKVSSKAELSMSFNVLFHLVEDENYLDHLHNLFTNATRYVILYAPNHNDEKWTRMYRCREFLPDVERLYSEWELEQVIPQKYTGRRGSPCDFYIFKKNGKDNKS